MIIRSRLHSVVAAAAMLAGLFPYSCAIASSDAPWDGYVKRTGTDIALDRYQAGTLGVVLPTYERAYLYSAWRSVALGATGLTSVPNPKGALATLIQRRQGGGWSSHAPDREVYGAWRDAVALALKREMSPPRNKDLVLESYLNCPVASYTFATNMLTALVKRPDATPARLEAWVSAQRQVFKACGDDPEAQRRGYGQPKPVVPLPETPPTTEALYWRQMREYQLASAAFYGEDYARSGALFAKIGATDKHPMQPWGAYLSLRSQARAALFVPGSDEARWKAQQEEASESPAAAALRTAARQQKMDAIQASIDRIVGDPALKERHEDSRVIGRSMLARLTPEPRFAHLSKLLDDPQANPYVDDHLGDWAVLADHLLATGTDTSMALRKTVSFVDWIQSVQCRDVGASANCAGERAHAAELWARHLKKGNVPQARVWLMATAMLSTTLAPEIEKAILQVQPEAPEYATLRLALARHYRLSQQPEKARAVIDAALTNRESNSARNLFLQERFAATTTTSEAAAYLMRAENGSFDADTGEQAKSAPQRPETVAADGQRWLNSGLAAADLYALGADTRLPQTLRARIGVAAWMRFDLLGQDEDALKAAQQVEQSSKLLAPVMRKYRALPDAPERRHWLLLNATRYNLTPMAGAYVPGDISLQPADDATASMWCKMPAKAGAEYSEDVKLEKAPAMPQTGDVALRDKELAQLGALKTATGFLGEHVMQRAVKVPNDPDLPWLLHVVVQSTRGGCLDDDAKSLSKRAFNLLHKRYGKSEWAEKTPYFY